MVLNTITKFVYDETELQIDLALVFFASVFSVCLGTPGPRGDGLYSLSLSLGGRMFFLARVLISRSLPLVLITGKPLNRPRPL
jgi:hypothetical protein